MAVVAVAGALVAGTAFAQQPQAPGDDTSVQRAERAEDGFGKRGRWHRGHPGGGLGLGYSLRSLDLTDAQREQVHAVMQRHREELRAAVRKVTEARRALESASAAASVDESTIRAAAGPLAEAEADLALMRARVRVEVWDVLTPEQRTRAEALQQQQIQRREQRRERMDQRRPAPGGANR